jgi:Mn2+/Fe2+ NRAMP family transporter
MGVADENATGPAETPTSTSPVVGSSKPRLLQLLGPGLITGASDDDPSGIGTYSQAGAQLGFTVSWTMLFTYPLMAAIQEISGRVGRTTGRGIAGIVCRHYPNWLLQSIVALLFVANTINIGADLGAMADALKLLIGGPHLVYVVLFALVPGTSLPAHHPAAAQTRNSQQRQMKVCNKEASNQKLAGGV